MIVKLSNAIFHFFHAYISLYQFAVEYIFHKLDHLFYKTLYGLNMFSYEFNIMNYQIFNSNTYNDFFLFLNIEFQGHLH